MRKVYGGSFPGNTRTGGQILQNEDTPDRFVQRRVTHINGERIYFRDLARFAWPDKTDAHLAFHLRVDPRTARRWLSPDDKNEPPADALGVILAEIMKRFHQR
jgi:hypothetical protein